MERLEPRQKQEWKSGLDDHWLRTGCLDFWDAVFIAFRDYRDASPEKQQQIVKERTNIPQSPSEEWISSLHHRLQQVYEDKDEEDEMFFYLVPMKLISSDIVPYLKNYVNSCGELTFSDLHTEIIDKCFLLADYRQKKKNKFLKETTEELRSFLQQYLLGICNTVLPFSYETLQRAMENMEHQLMILSSQEEVLFDSKTWGDGIEGQDYQDVILVLAHPDGRFDSIGRLSYTKDGHQKISRLFHYDDPVIEALRE